jgi:hypothetical protein
MSYKKTIDNLITQRYNHFLKCATNILKDNKNIEPEELISELVIYLYNNKDKVKEYIKLDKLEAFCVSWLTIQGRYQTSPTQIKHSQKEYSIDEGTPTPVYVPDSEDYLDEFEKDLSSIYTDEQIKKILSVYNVYDELTKSEQILFRAYFIDNLSYDKIVNKYTFYRLKDDKKITYKSKKSIYNMMIALKTKIILLIEENDANNN